MILITKDGKRIAFTYYSAVNPVGWIIYAHMMPATKESWDGLARSFSAIGYEGIAVDLRGHGNSDGGAEGYQNFSDEEHQKSIYDIEGAVEYLKGRGADPGRITLIGASIGANLVLKYIVENSDFKKAVLLSAGLNYKGIEAVPLARMLREGQSVMLVASRDDGRTGGNNAEQNRAIFDAMPEGVNKKLQIYDEGGHGTALLGAHADLQSLIIRFMIGANEL